MPSTSPDSDAPAVAVEQVADESGLGPLAGRLVAALPRPAFLTLSGDLVAGKTTFVKVVAAAVGIDPGDVLSPTFGLIHEYPTPQQEGVPPRIVHADLYRLTGPSDLAETGWDDAAGGDAWVFVEWPERMAEALPAERIEIAIGIESPTARRFTFTGFGRTHRAAVASLKQPPP